MPQKKPVKKKTTPVEDEANEDLLPSMVDTLLNKLDFSAEGVVQAAAEQPKLFMHAADLRVHAMRKAMALKSALKVFESTAEMSIRKTAAVTGEKLTENSVKAQVALEENVMQTQSKLDDAEADEEAARLLVEAYRMRRDSMRAIGDMVAAGVRAESAQQFAQTNMENLTKALNKKYAGGE